MVRRVELLPKQLRFLRSTAPNCLYSGSVRAGKSYALCWKTVLRAQHPGAREALVRKFNVTIAPTTLKTLLVGDGLNPPVLPPGSYEWRKVDQEIKIHGGGEIVYFGLDDLNKIGSRSLTGVNIDEVQEVFEADYDMLQTRVSIDLPGLSKQINGACNPGPPGHFLARRFGLARGQFPNEGYEALQTHSAENWYLTQDYLDRINRLTGSTYQRLVLGRWVGSEGVVYDTWDREVHVTTREQQWDRILVGVDDGYANPFAVVVAGLDGDGRMHVLGNLAEAGLTNREKIERTRELVSSIGIGEDRIECWAVDAAAAQLIDEMNAAGIPAEGADKAVVDGIQCVQQRLALRGDGTPGLTVDPTCAPLITEFETYEWIERKGTRLDQPKKADDHSLDALRYLCMAARTGTLEIY